MIQMKNILVATDLGESADAAVACGRELAATFGATLQVLYVAEAIAPPSGSRDVEDAARKQLDDLLSDDDRATFRATSVVLTSTSPARSIVDYAKEAAINLIVIGTPSHGPTAQLAMGTVTERVVRTAPCPVLIVQSPAHPFAVSETVAASAAV
jgi:nucleotide-binding universal stress UspA family protein